MSRSNPPADDCIKHGACKAKGLHVHLAGSRSRPCPENPSNVDSLLGSACSVGTLSRGTYCDIPDLLPKMSDLSVRSYRACHALRTTQRNTVNLHAAASWMHLSDRRSVRTTRLALTTELPTAGHVSVCRFRFVFVARLSLKSHVLSLQFLMIFEVILSGYNCCIFRT